MKLQTQNRKGHRPDALHVNPRGAFRIPLTKAEKQRLHLAQLAAFSRSGK